jgi:S-adenosylmethionine:diacylglycerol 3-amino-3-carboxypropyl transferase
MKLVFTDWCSTRYGKDPEVDKTGWNINNNDIIVTITSAGCNALDYLISSPELIYALDINRQRIIFSN